MYQRINMYTHSPTWAELHLRNETGGCTVLVSFPGEVWEQDWWMYCISLIPGGGLGTRLVDVLY